MFPENKKDIAVTNVYQYRSNHVFFKTGVLKNLPVFTEKHLCLRVFLIKLQASFSRIQSECGKIRPATSLKRHSNTGVSFFVNIAKFLRTALL